MDLEDVGRPIVSGIVVAIIGLALSGLGGWLIALGGSLYYLLAGLATLASGILIAGNSRAGIRLYGVLLAATTIWALAEVGLDGWALIPRLVAPAALGVWLCTPWVAGRLETRAGAGPPAALGRCLAGMATCALLIALVFAAGFQVTASRTIHAESPAPPRGGPQGDDGADWAVEGRTLAGDRFSPLAQITPANVAQLRPAWTIHIDDADASRLQATPIKVADALYLCTPHRRVVAFDAATGTEAWRFDAGGATPAPAACRGVAWFEAPPGTPCPRRILTTAPDPPRLIALDAATGRPCEGFGAHGIVDLGVQMGGIAPGGPIFSSPPLVMHGEVILGGEAAESGGPSGVIRAFDGVTGRLVWSWDLGRPDPLGRPAPDETYVRGTPGAAGALTADPALGMVYVPLGNAPPDHFGGDRRAFDDAYSGAVVALDVATGRERWHFQTVHHDLWGFGLPVGPSLVDIPDHNGNTIPALLQTTKQGQLFLLDRRNGRPLAEVAERQVAQGDVPGERYARTQPFSVGMPALSPEPLGPADTWGLTPLDQALCRIALRQMRYDGLFTPPGLRRTLGYPAYRGVTDGSGGTIDPERHVLLVTATAAASSFTLGDAPGRSPRTIMVEPWHSLLGVPCIRPPWGQMEAIDLDTRRILWQRPIGTTRGPGATGWLLPFALPTGIFATGGGLVTRSGLVFVGATADGAFRALDEADGRTLWEVRLDAPGHATPMTYLGRDGRQYVVIVAGGNGETRTDLSATVTAYALPPGAPAP